MATTTRVGPVEERRKQKGTSSVGPRPPNKKKLDKSVDAIGQAIADKEASLKLISWNPTQTLSAELAQLMSQLSEAKEKKKDNTIQVEKIEEDIQSLGAEVIDKKNEASTLIAGVRHKTEEKIDEAVSKLELQLTMRQHSAPQERNIRHEIITLTNSKERLRAYLQLKSEIEDMRIRQEGLRKKRDALYRSNGSLRERIGSLKDRSTEKRLEIDQLKDRRKEALARKDAIVKEIYDLKQQRRQLHDEFRAAQALYHQATSEERVREVERHNESRREERRARRRTLHDQLPVPRPHYHEEKSTCNTLISYIEKLSLSHPSSDDTTPNSTPSLSSPTLDQSNPSTRPGEFLRRKEDERGEVLIPAVTRRKSKRDKRRHTISSKVGKSLNHNAATISQFSVIGLTPPYSSLDLPYILTQLHEKLTFYTSKSQSGLAAESEAGDSGVGSTAWPDDTDLHTPLTISQEDIPNEALSPRRSLTDSINGLSPKSLAPERSLTDSLAGQAAGSLVSASSGSSLTTQSSTSSTIAAMVVANGIEE